MNVLTNFRKNECYGCEACVQICPRKAIAMVEDEEGFRYPMLDSSACTDCRRCSGVCPWHNMPQKYGEDQYVYGGYHKDPAVRFHSTSGGAFSAIAGAFCDDNYVIFGAASKGLKVFHTYITDIRKLRIFQKSKYSQSVIGGSYRKAKEFLKNGKKVLFSGTPCQIAGLRAFLGNADQHRLLTVEVICEGVPSPLYMRKYNEKIRRNSGDAIKYIDYRYKDKTILMNNKWDFEVMLIKTEKGAVKKADRWVNPFWSVWLQHLMSRPSCYKCQFTTSDRVADITLGDLWGVHLYCPELYGKNGGSSLVICNTEKGKRIFDKSKDKLYGHRLYMDDVLKYQGPLKRHISDTSERIRFMSDLKSEMDIDTLNRKWAEKPTLKLLYDKYIWGNRQRVLLFRLKRIISYKKGYK